MLAAFDLRIFMRHLSGSGVDALSFFIGFLVPDIFASLLILGVAIVWAFWDTLLLRDRILIFTITSYAALTHASHLLLLIGLFVLLGAHSYFTERNTRPHCRASSAPQFY